MAYTCLCACEQVHGAEALARGPPNRDRMTVTFKLDDDEASSTS